LLVGNVPFPFKLDRGSSFQGTKSSRFEFFILNRDNYSNRFSFPTKGYSNFLARFDFFEKGRKVGTNFCYWKILYSDASNRTRSKVSDI